MPDFRDKAKQELNPILEHLASELSLLHAGRATPALVEHIMVAAYGGKMPLKEVASLSVPDVRSILVQPWDSSLLGEIQKALEASHLGFGMAVQENLVRLTLPALSEERRKEMQKLMGKRVEEARIAMRRVRDHIGKAIEEAERSKELSEDEKFRSKESLQKTIDEYNGRISELEKRKENDIRT